MEAQRPDKSFALVQVDALGRLLFALAGAEPVDRSGAIAAGGAAQPFLPADTARRGAWLQNLSSGDLWVCDVGGAGPAAPSLRIGPGVLYEWPAGGCPVGAVSIYGATTGQAFSGRSW